MNLSYPLCLEHCDLLEYTPYWTGDRFPDGRPKVSDQILDRMLSVTLTEAWSVLTNEGFRWQYASDFICTQPGQALVGRAITAIYMPRRPDMRAVMETNGSLNGHHGDQISWPIDLLVPRDVYVADVFGKIEEGAVIGDNLATAIYLKSGNGVVHDAAIRDLDGIKEMTGFVSFVRGFHPSYASPTIMLCGINVPTRIGSTTVMPGDIVLGRDSGVIFIPPHLAEKVVKTSELVRLRDAFSKIRINEGIYTSGQVDARWTEPMERDFSLWLENHHDELPIDKSAIDELLRERTW